MKLMRKTLAGFLAIALVLVMIPVTMGEKTTQAAEAATITAPIQNSLVAAGYVQIQWEAAQGSVKNYEVYVDNQKVTTTTQTKCEYYTTKVKKFTLYVRTVYTNGGSNNSDVINFFVSKKGLGLGNDMGSHAKLKEWNIAWYYNWGTAPSGGTQYNGVEYVPMQWGPDDANNINNKMNNWANKGYNYVLAYNEPDLTGQGVISVDDAANRWWAFQNHGIHVGSPASFLWPSISSWLKDFMVKIDNNVDFVTIHCYPENNPGGESMAKWFLKEVVDAAWEQYHKPIWITEFSTHGENVPADGTTDFWEYVMPGLDEREYVERYAAFCYNAYKEPNVGLWNYNTGVLTEAGEAYADLGTPEGYDYRNLPQPEYEVSVSSRNALLANQVTINKINCEDYVAKNGVTATASSEINGNVASKVMDSGENAFESRWESKQKVDPQHLIIDLGQVRNIKQVSVLWENASAAEYDIEISTDGNTYTKVATVTSNQGGRCDAVVFSTMKSARYVKIQGKSRTTQYGYSIRDMAIYGTNDATVDETTTPPPTQPRTRRKTTQPTTNIIQNQTIQEEQNTTTQGGEKITVNEETSGENVTAETSALDTSNTTGKKVEVKRPERVVLKKATKRRSGKKARIVLKKLKGVSGYQIRFCDNKKYQGYEQKNIKKNQKKITLKGLEKHTKYFVKIRAFYLMNGTRVYGAWSKSKKIKMKK